MEAAVTFPLLLTENPSGMSLVPIMSAFVAVPPTTPSSLHRTRNTPSGPFHWRAIRALCGDRLRALRYRDEGDSLGCGVSSLLLWPLPTLFWAYCCCSVLLQVRMPFSVLLCCRAMKPFLP